MGLRFRKVIKLAPGLRMNVGLRGLSMSLGPRGSSVSVGRSGVYGNVGFPGTGLSTRTRLGVGLSQGYGAQARRPEQLSVSFRLQDDGGVEIVGADGSALPPSIVKLARTQYGQLLRAWLEEKCELWNKGIDDLTGIHLKTPPPSDVPQDVSRRPYPVPRPSEFTPIRPNLAERVFRNKRERVDRLNSEASQQYAKACRAWEEARAEHEARETVRLELFDPSMPLKADRVQEYLSDVLGRVEWPRETIVSLDCDDPVTGVMIDIDLPEIEDLPDKSAAVAARGLKLNIKDRPETQRCREYMTHVHGVAFRVIGEVFAALPRIQRVMCSGFSQRVDRNTGQVGEEYLFSIRVPRSSWSAINFSRLADLDLPSCLGTFDIRREMTSKGVFRPIEPFGSFEGVA